jgi:hypothetical protein
MVLFVAMMIMSGAGLAALHFYSRLRRLDTMTRTASPLPDPGRYKPMLRLLSSDDEQLLASNPQLLRTFRKERMKIFRNYLRSLTRDYGTLLAGIRNAMVLASGDRPDLATALAKNQALFAMAVCRIEYRLALYSIGLGAVDVSGLVEAIDRLRAQVGVMTPTALPSAA